MNSYDNIEIELPSPPDVDEITKALQGKYDTRVVDGDQVWFLPTRYRFASPSIVVRVVWDPTKKQHILRGRVKYPFLIRIFYLVWHIPILGVMFIGVPSILLRGEAIGSAIIILFLCTGLIATNFLANRGRCRSLSRQLASQIALTAGGKVGSKEGIRSGTFRRSE